MTFEERQRRRRAAGRSGTARLIEYAMNRDPEMGAYADWLADEPGATSPPLDALQGLAELRGAIVAIKILKARREMAALGRVLTEDPTSPNVPRWRARVAELIAALRAFERSAGAGNRPWAQIVAREETAPPRRPR